MLEAIWGAVLPNTAQRRWRWLGGAIGALATAVGLVLSKLLAATVLFEAPSLTLFLGLCVANMLPIALALLSWRCVAAARNDRARDVAPSAVLGAYWSLAAIAASMGGARTIHETIGVIVLWGGSLGVVPMVVFCALAIEGMARRSALSRATIE